MFGVFGLVLGVLIYDGYMEFAVIREAHQQIVVLLEKLWLTC